MSWEDDIHVGMNYAEIGEALRGMQSLGAGKAVSALQRRLGALSPQVAQRFGVHTPVSKAMRSPYRDSTQFSVSATGTFVPQNWAGSALPQISGLSRVYTSFKPEKAIVEEDLRIVYQNSTGTRTRAKTMEQGQDLVLVAAFAGALNCFPNAPTESTGISGVALANVSYGNGISWPTLNGGIDMTVTFAVKESALFVIDPPAGFTEDDIVEVKVSVRLNLFGPSLR